MSKELSITPAESAGTKARRTATKALSFIGQHLDLAGMVVVLLVAVAGTFHVGSESLQETGSGMNLWVFVLTVFGATQALLYVSVHLAEVIDPDVRDGDMVLEAAAILKQVREDIANGAELDDVLDCLREANLGTALSDLLEELATARESENQQSVTPLWSAALTSRAIDRAVALPEL